MNFIEAIEPYNERLDAYQKLKSYSGADINEIRELVNIFMDYVANPKGDMIPSLGCGNCISKMFQRLVTHREIERCKNIDFLNSHANSLDVPDLILHNPIINNQLDLEDQIKQEEIETLKQLCDEQGIKYHHKAGIKKLSELLNE